jgi:hypothetical protein
MIVSGSLLIEDGTSRMCSNDTTTIQNNISIHVGVEARHSQATFSPGWSHITML